MAGILGAGYVNGEIADSIFKPGVYGHGDKIFDGGSYGLMIVFKSELYNYFAQIEINLLGLFFRMSTGTTWSEWTKL